MSAPTQPPFFLSEPQTQNIIGQDNVNHSTDSYMPVIIILTVIAFLSVASCILGRMCSRRWNGHVSSDLEKGEDMAKSDITTLNNKAAANLKMKSKMAMTPKCELHGNKKFGKLLATKETASVKSKKQGLNRCEVHGIYLPRYSNRSDLSGANDEQQS